MFFQTHSCVGFSKFEKQPISSKKLTSIENCNIKISQKKKMKKYRGKGYKNYNENHLNNLKILLLNIRGFKSKEVSLQNVTKLFHPSIIKLNKSTCRKRKCQDRKLYIVV